MGINISKAQLEAAYVTVSGALNLRFNQLRNSDRNWAKQFWMSIPSGDADTITYNMIEATIGLSQIERNKPVPLRTFLGMNTTMTVQRYGDGVKIKHHDIVHDRLGLYKEPIDSIAEGAALLENDLIVRSWLLGTTSAFNGYDGVPLFSNAHPRPDGTTTDNLFGFGALSKLTFQAARTAFRRFPPDRQQGLLSNRVYGAVPNVLVVTPDNEYTANELMRNTYVKGGQGEAENVLKGMATVVVIDDNPDADNWQLAKTDAPVKPYARYGLKDFDTWQQYVSGLTPESEEFKNQVLSHWGSQEIVVYPTRWELQALNEV